MRDLMEPSLRRFENPCRHNPTLICQIEGVRFYGASRVRLNAKTLAAVDADLLVNLTGLSLYDASNQPIRRAPDRWKELLEYFQPTQVEEIVIDWPDMGTIKAGPYFWAQFFRLIKENGKKNVVVFCIGGHGRTGTFVASMMTVMNGIHGGKAIRAIRDGYCKQAVETRQQEDYVRSMTTKEGGENP
jgi:hypothetical protein